MLCVRENFVYEVLFKPHIKLWKKIFAIISIVIISSMLQTNKEWSKRLNNLHKQVRGRSRATVGAPEMTTEMKHTMFEGC